VLVGGWPALLALRDGDAIMAVDVRRDHLTLAQRKMHEALEQVGIRVHITGKRPPRDGPQRPWTTKELQTLRANAAQGAAGVAELLDRSIASVKRQAQQQRISLRLDGERRGLLIGQPRAISFRSGANKLAQLVELRRAALAGEVDLQMIERRVRLIAHGAPLCPACTARPIEKASTGLCTDCHLDGLTDQHRLASRTVLRQRELDLQRQNKARARRGRVASAPPGM